MVLSVSTWSAHEQLYHGNMSKEGFVKLLHKHGVSGMEVVDIDFRDTSFESMKELQDIGRAYGVEITCMSLEHDLCQYTEEERQTDVDKVIRWMETAKKLGVRNVCLRDGSRKGSPIICR